MKQALIVDVPQQLYDFINNNRDWFIGRDDINSVCTDALCDAAARIRDRKIDYSAGVNAYDASIYSDDTKRLVRAILADQRHDKAKRLDIIMDAMRCSTEHSNDFWAGYFMEMAATMTE